MRLSEFKNVLTATGIKVFHGEALKCDDNFLSWFETSKKYQFADNRRNLCSYIVEVFYVTKTEYDETAVEKIEDSFDENDICYSAAEINYISEKKAWVYSWKCEFSYGI